MAEMAAAKLQSLALMPRCSTCGRVLNVNGTCTNAIRQSGAHAPESTGK